jgi:hypothetical protein
MTKITDVRIRPVAAVLGVATDHDPAGCVFLAACEKGAIHDTPPKALFGYQPEALLFHPLCD